VGFLLPSKAYNSRLTALFQNPDNQYLFWLREYNAIRVPNYRETRKRKSLSKKIALPAKSLLLVSIQPGM